MNSRPRSDDEPSYADDENTKQDLTLMGANRSDVEATTHPPAGLVVVQVHQHPREVLRVTRIVLLLFADVDKAECEPVAVLGVVAAAAPQPVGVELARTGPSAAAARLQFAVATGSADGVRHSAGEDGVQEGDLAAC